MRCPKCGYISFDHVETCLKCKKSIPASGEVEGTTYHAAAPSFLKVPKMEESAEESDASPELEFDTEEESFEVTDPDLDVLVDEEEEISFEGSDEDEAVLSIDDAGLKGAEDEYQLDPEEEVEFTIEPEEELDEEVAVPSLNVPEELSDISDLAPPEETQAAQAAPEAEVTLSLDDEQGVDENRDLDGLDLDFGAGQAKETTDEEVSLSLDDIDFSVEEDTELGDLDIDLSFDELDPAPAPKKKSSSELDGITLSLD